MAEAELDGTSTDWVPAACTLPTVEQPVRLAEFDELLATAVRSVYRAEPARLCLEFDPDPEVAARVAELMVRESGCCSFFAFALSMADHRLRWDVTVPTERVRVLDALTARALAGGNRG
ncbi:hypothetical protein I0C86_04550 [Plantactinospora sp. S1510]|uniref:Arsenate reductase n=1 Tax=Plantactinospora alkalitolerans TaxID=2789879 RepID=A0ABS0GPY8_9ACTN|nr:hypothetical protein [Plantactinospora alkalitolerans]MBF9128268.1 hypothetical protein [Plantactinospora alkalitolerans]